MTCTRKSKGFYEKISLDTLAKGDLATLKCKLCNVRIIPAEKFEHILEHIYENQILILKDVQGLKDESRR